jgi:hypothetical protein
VKTLVSVDFFVVPTIRFQILYLFLVLAHERRRIVHFAVTAHPTAEWTAQQMRESLRGIRHHLLSAGSRSHLWPRLRVPGEGDGHPTGAVGTTFPVATCLRGAAHRYASPRVPGSPNRVPPAKPVPAPPAIFMDYYHRNPVHFALENDAPEPRPIQPPEPGRIVSMPVLGGWAASPIRTARRLSHPTTYVYPSKCCSFRSALVLRSHEIKSELRLVTPSTLTPAINETQFGAHGLERHLSSTNSVAHFTPDAISEIDSLRVGSQRPEGRH